MHLGSYLATSAPSGSPSDKLPVQILPSFSSLTLTQLTCQSRRVPHRLCRRTRLPHCRRLSTQSQQTRRPPSPRPTTLNVSQTLPRWPPLRFNPLCPPPSSSACLPLPRRLVGRLHGLFPFARDCLRRPRQREAPQLLFPADRAVCQHRRRCLLGCRAAAP